MSSEAPTEQHSNLSDAARRLLAARQNLNTSMNSNSAANTTTMTGDLLDFTISPGTPASTATSNTTGGGTTTPHPPPQTHTAQITDLVNAKDELDLKNNDDAYHIIASLIADKLEYQREHGQNAEADEVMNSLLPFKVQKDFQVATDFRLKALPSVASAGETETQSLTRKCAGFRAVEPTASSVAAGAQPMTPPRPTLAGGAKYQPPTALLVPPTPERHDTSSIVNVSPNVNQINTEAQSLNIQSKARQQLIQEIADSKRLMDQATTAEASLFWKKHLDMLHASLMRLTGQTPSDVDELKGLYQKAPDGTPGSNVRQSPMQVNTGSDANKMTTKDLPISTPTQDVNPNAKKVWVIAPANLPGGYRFEAQINERKFLATVPPGGVVKGQTFMTDYQDLDRIVMSVPVGEWRDGLCDFWEHGICHPLLLCTIWCPLIALGQIMTRSRLTWTGSAGPIVETKMTYTSVWMILLFWMALNVILVGFPLTKPHPFYTEDGSEIDWTAVGPICALNGAFFLYNLCAVCRTRSSIREKYQIPDKCCGCMEDLCCATACYCCTIQQVGRHTADYNTYRAVCCSSTGLPVHVECPDGPSETMALYGPNDGQQSSQAASGNKRDPLLVV